MPLRRLLLIFCAAWLPACDLVEPLPDEPPPDGPTHPYGEGNGKVVFLSDLAAAEQIDVTLGGEPIGAVTRFTGCPGRVTTDDSLAVAIRPAGRYQYEAESTGGIQWTTSTVTITEDELTRLVFFGAPSLYARHLPDEFEGLPAARSDQDYYVATTTSAALRLVVQRPNVVAGDRIDIVVNGVVVTRGLALGTSDVELSATLLPGPNWIAVRLSADPDGNGTTSLVRMYNGDRYLYDTGTVVGNRWNGVNFRYAC